jgi:CheY-like chemotaxis protein
MAANNSKHAIRVLYVEDDKSLQLTISQMLTILGYVVETADNGKLGVEKAESWRPDIILMDVRMPLMNGDEAIRVLREKPETAAIPIFVLSAYNDARIRNLCEQAGATRFFTKPADVRKVDMAIKETLNSA